MPSTYTQNGGIEKIASGEQSGTWGQTTNDNFDIIDRLTNGVATLTLTGASSNLTTSDGVLSDGQNKVLVLDGTPGVTHTITVVPANAQKLYFVKNNTINDVIFDQGSGDNATVEAGQSAVIFCDGAGATAACTNLLETEDLTIYAQKANNLSDLTDAATALTNLGVTATAAELNYNDITTLGTSQPSKVLTADSSGAVKFSNAVVETIYSLTGTNIDPNNGTVQVAAISSNTTFTESLSSGESVSLSLTNPSGYTVTFPTITWVSGDGDVAPTLTAADTVVLFKINTTLYGVWIGSSA